MALRIQIYDHANSLVSEVECATSSEVYALFLVAWEEYLSAKVKALVQQTVAMPLPIVRIRVWNL